MDAGVIFAVHAERADAAGLGHAVDVEHLDAEAGGEAFLHLVREGFGAENTDFELRQRTLLLLQNFHDADAVADHRGQHRAAEIAREPDLPERIAGAARHDEHSVSARAVVAAEPAVEEPEPRRDLADVVRLRAGHRITARHALGPLPEVGRGIRHDHRGSGRPARHVHFGKVLPVDAAHPERIFAPEIFLAHRRQFRKVVEAAELRDVDPGPFEVFREETAVRGGVADDRLQPGVPQRVQFIGGHRLRRRVEKFYSTHFKGFSHIQTHAGSTRHRRA